MNSNLCLFCSYLLNEGKQRTATLTLRLTFYSGGEEKQRRKRRKIFREGKYFSSGGEETQRRKRRKKYLEKISPKVVKDIEK